MPKTLFKKLALTQIFRQNLHYLVHIFTIRIEVGFYVQFCRRISFLKCLSLCSILELIFSFILFHFVVKLSTSLAKCFIVPTIENGEKLCTRVCFSFFSFCFSREIRFHKKSSDWVEWFIISAPLQSGFDP